MLLQYPDTFGIIDDLQELSERVHSAGAHVVVASDLLALTLLKPPGEWGADIVVGSSQVPQQKKKHLGKSSTKLKSILQRFGVPFGFGGPHAAFFACRQAFLRKAPGRIIGVSRDSEGNRALRMALQVRPTECKRDELTIEYNRPVNNTFVEAKPPVTSALPKVVCLGQTYYRSTDISLQRF